MWKVVGEVVRRWGEVVRSCVVLGFFFLKEKKRKIKRKMGLEKNLGGVG